MRISVVLATFNGSRFLPDQLDSILDGTRPPDEMVVVDDASSDNSVALVEERLQRSTGTALVLLRNKTNIGASASFALGVAATTGDLLLFSDQDDRWMPHKIAVLERAFIQDPRLCMAYSDGLITNSELEPDGRTIFGTRNKAKLLLGAQREPIEVAFNPDIKGCTMALDAAFARALFATTPPGFERYWGHDHWAAIHAYGTGKVHALNEPLLWHRFHGSNASGAVRFNPFRVDHWRRYLKAIKAQGPDHYHERYRLLLDHIRATGADVVPELRAAIGQCLAISARRRDLKALPLFARSRVAARYYREGIYDNYNGAFTALRDVLL